MNFLNIAFLDFFKFKLADFQRIKFIFLEAEQKVFWESIFPLSFQSFLSAKEAEQKGFSLPSGLVENLF